MAVGRRATHETTRTSTHGAATVEATVAATAAATAAGLTSQRPNDQRFDRPDTQGAGDTLCCRKLPDGVHEEHLGLFHRMPGFAPALNARTENTATMFVLFGVGKPRAGRAACAPRRRGGRPYGPVRLEVSSAALARGRREVSVNVQERVSCCWGSPVAVHPRTHTSTPLTTGHPDAWQKPR